MDSLFLEMKAIKCFAFLNWKQWLLLEKKVSENLVECKFSSCNLANYYILL